MTSRDEQYAPGAASGAEVRKDGDKWTLVLVRDLPHNPKNVWKALTDPERLREWAPFDSDRNLGSVGTAKLSTVGATPPAADRPVCDRVPARRVAADQGPRRAARERGVTISGTTAGLR